MSRSPENQPSPASSLALLCRICGNRVAIASAKTDGDGKAVHEECYAAKITSNHSFDAQKLDGAPKKQRSGKGMPDDKS